MTNTREPLQDPVFEAVDSIRGHIYAFAHVINELLARDAGSVLYVEAFEDIQIITQDVVELIQCKARRDKLSLSQLDTCLLLDRWARVFEGEPAACFTYISTQGITKALAILAPDTAGELSQKWWEATEACRVRLLATAMRQTTEPLKHLRAVAETSARFEEFWSRISWHTGSANNEAFCGLVRQRLADRFPDDPQPHRFETYLGRIAVSAAQAHLSERRWTWAKLTEPVVVADGLVQRLVAVLLDMRSLRDDRILKELKELRAQLAAKGGVRSVGASDCFRLSDLQVATVSRYAGAWNTLAVTRPPAWYIPRPEEHEQAVRALLHREIGATTAMTTAIWGTGGFGKSMLAQSVGSDERIRRRFCDGVGWVTLGESPDLVPLVGRLIQSVSGERPTIATLSDAAVQIRDLLSNREFLLIIDDVWRRKDLAVFGDAAAEWPDTSCRVLITTRISGCQPPGCATVRVDEMSTNQGAALLQWGLPIKKFSGSDAQAVADLADFVGRWPVLLAIVRDELRNRLCAGTGLSLLSAVAQVRQTLEAGGMTAFDRLDQEKRDRAVAATLEMSLARLSLEDFQRLVDMSAFPDDVPIPFDALECIWSADDRTDGERRAVPTVPVAETLARLSNQSLIQRLNFETGTVQLHDVIRDYLRRHKGGRTRDRAIRVLESLRNGRPARSGQWAQRVRSLCECLPGGASSRAARMRASLRKLATPEAQWWPVRAETLRYLRPHVNWHLEQAQHLREAADLRVDPAWTRVYPVDSPCTALAPVSDHAVVVGLKSGEVRMLNLNTGLSPLLFHHSRAVRAIVVLECGRIVSASLDNTLRVWEPSSRRTRILHGHVDGVLTVAMVKGMGVVSGGYDKTVRWWNIDTGSHSVVAQERGAVNALIGAEGGRYVSAAGSDISLWQLELDGSESLRVVGNHSSRITALSLLPGDRVASSSWDGSVCVWELSTDKKRPLGKGTASFTSVVAFDGGLRIASGSTDATIQLWDLKSLQNRELVGHGATVNCLAVLPGGSIVSGADDKTIRIWESSTRRPAQTQTAQGH